MDLYNHLTSPLCVRRIAKGWDKAGISDLLDGQTDLPPEDPFTDIELYGVISPPKFKLLFATLLL